MSVEIKGKVISIFISPKKGEQAFTQRGGLRAKILTNEKLRIDDPIKVG